MPTGSKFTTIQQPNSASRSSSQPNTASHQRITGPPVWLKSRFAAAPRSSRPRQRIRTSPLGAANPKTDLYQDIALAMPYIAPIKGAFRGCRTV